MKAIVLVGGEGTRLRPLTYTTPKPLLPIANQPFLERQLTWLAGHGVDEVVLSLGYLPDAFEAHFPTGRYGDMLVRYAVEDHPLGTAGAIRFAAEGIDERVIVCNGDVLTDLDLDALVAFHDARDAEATLCLTRVDDPSAFGVVPTRGDGEVVAFVEKPPKGRVPSNWINAGTYVLEPSVLERIPERLTVSIERETFPRMLEDPRRMFAMASDAYWLDIGTPDNYLQAHADVLAGALGAPAADAREIVSGLWAQGDVEVDAAAVIEGPVLLGDGVAVAAGARISRSVVGRAGTIGPDAKLEGAVLLDGAVVKAGAEVVDSVIGSGATVGAGAIASNRTVMGADATLAAGALVSGARIRYPEADAGD